MKELLIAIKSELQTSLATDVRSGDIFITPDLSFIPSKAMKPCVGIKDGKIGREELAGNMLELTLYVSLAVYVQLFKEEAGIVGDTSTNQKGVLELTGVAVAALDANLLSITGMQSAFAESESGSGLFSPDGQVMLSRKIINLKYVKEVQRP